MFLLSTFTSRRLSTRVSEVLRAQGLDAHGRVSLVAAEHPAKIADTSRSSPPSPLELKVDNLLVLARHSKVAAEIGLELTEERFDELRSKLDEKTDDPSNLEAHQTVHRLMEEADEQEERADKAEERAKSLKKDVGALEDEVRQMAQECLQGTVDTLDEDGVPVEHFPAVVAVEFDILQQENDHLEHKVTELRRKLAASEDRFAQLTKFFASFQQPQPAALSKAKMAERVSGLQTAV
eukprot:COSAG04_NODE_6151_length_1397_cov_0.629430_2_plen_237_part_00